MCECPDRVAVIRPHRVAWEWECGRSGEMCQSECLRRGQRIASLEAARAQTETALAAEVERRKGCERLMLEAKELLGLMMVFDDEGCESPLSIREWSERHDAYRAKYAEKGEVKNG